MIDTYAVIGNPIAQSRSPMLHQAFARQLGHQIDYQRILAGPDDFERVVRSFQQAGGKGMNVTAPFKLAALQLADVLSDRARAAQAVNTLSFTARGIEGDNTDGIGLLQDIQERLGFGIGGRKVLLVGAGGAARGVLLPLLQAGPESLLLVNRTPERAIELVQPWKQEYPVHAGDLDSARGGYFDVVINATSAGLQGAGLDLGEQLYADQALAYDMVYGQGETPFLRDARKQGAAVRADGLGMLLAQAAQSYRIWRGQLPDISSLIKSLDFNQGSAS